jgi:hypothetical protein
MKEGYWLHIQEYDKTYKPEVKGNTLHLRIPRHHVLGLQTIRMMRQRKNERVEQIRNMPTEEP